MKILDDDPDDYDEPAFDAALLRVKEIESNAKKEPEEQNEHEKNRINH